MNILNGDRLIISAWAPSHATLFFSTPEKNNIPELTGSIGGGLNFGDGILTTIKNQGNNTIKWNEKVIDGRVTKTTLKRFEEVTGVSTSSVDINHVSKIPIGYGLSTSGAGSIGTVLILDDYFNTQLDKIDLYEIAHYADVVNHTGLGSVVGQVLGGIELRFSQAGPRLCKTKKYNSNDEIILVFFGPLSTADVLTSSEQMLSVTKAGLETIKLFESEPPITLDNMISAGKEFTRKCGLLTDRVEKEIKLLDEILETKTTMAMIGETVIIHPNNMERTIEYLSNGNYNFLRTKISNEEPKIVEK